MNNSMGNFKNFFNNDTQRFFFESHYEDISEPLKEFTVGNDGSMYEISTSQTLLGVRKNGKWGWVDSNNMFVIQPIYDSGFVTCYNGVIIMQKHGEWGGIYRKNQLIAFSYKYAHLSHAYGNTYVARNSINKCALVKPGDKMLTGFNYKGFSVYNNGNVTEYVKSGFFGESKGFIDLETGIEL